MKRWLWTLVWSILVPFSPFGQELIYSAYHSGETISRDLGQFLIYCIAGIMIGTIIVEWLIQWWLARRRDA